MLEASPIPLQCLGIERLRRIFDKVFEVGIEQVGIIVLQQLPVSNREGEALLGNIRPPDKPVKDVGNLLNGSIDLKSKAMGILDPGIRLTGPFLFADLTRHFYAIISGRSVKANADVNGILAVLVPLIPPIPHRPVCRQIHILNLRNLSKSKCKTGCKKILEIQRNHPESKKRKNPPKASASAGFLFRCGLLGFVEKALKLPNLDSNQD